jgi:hypothetical protein
MAFYHAAVRICDYPSFEENTKEKGFINNIKRGFATLATGSAFFHGSMTYVGKRFDNDLIAMLAFYGQQIMVQKFKTNSTVIHELSLTPRR